MTQQNKLIKHCFLLVEQMQQLLNVINDTIAEAKEIERYKNLSTPLGFLMLAEINFSQEIFYLREAIANANNEDLFCSLFSIYSSYKYFTDEDFSWSKKWGQGTVYLSVLDKIYTIIINKDCFKIEG